MDKTRRRKDEESSKRSAPGRLSQPLNDPLRRYKQPLLTEGRGRALIEFDRLDVTAIREKFGVPRARFAEMIGVSYHTLRNWETGRRRPHGPSRALLRAIAADPIVLGRALLHWRNTPLPEDFAPWSTV